MPKEPSSSSSRPTGSRSGQSAAKSGAGKASAGARKGSPRTATKGASSAAPRKAASSTGKGRAPAAARGASPYKSVRSASGAKVNAAAGRPARPTASEGDAGTGRSDVRKGAPAKRSSTGTTKRVPVRTVEARKGWGSLARKGAANVRHGDEVGRKESTRELERIERTPDRVERFEIERVDPPRPKRASGKAQPDTGWRLPEEAIKELRERVPEKRAEKLAKHLKDAARAYAGERWGDVRKAMRPLLNDVPDAPSVQELHGMLLYRTGKWAAAAKELQAVHDATNSYDLVPAIMDCHRALKKDKKVAELWDDLRLASPSADVMAEGRIVIAETLADKGKLADAIALLEKAPRARQRVLPHHLRSMYVMADLYDRAGEVAKARTLFEKVAAHDPELADVTARLAALD